MNRRWVHFATPLLVLAMGTGGLARAVLSQDPTPDELRATSKQSLAAGDFQSAYQGFRQLALTPAGEPTKVGSDLQDGLQCLRQLNREYEIDEFREAVVAVHSGNWQLLKTAAESFFLDDARGALVAGVFQRGSAGSSDATLVDSSRRDRTRALQLFLQAMPLADQAAEPDDTAGFYIALANVLGWNAPFSNQRMQTLTELAGLPDYEREHPEFSVEGLPVDSQGAPIFFSLPASWEASQNDGQRWRWAYDQAQKRSPKRLNQVQYQQALAYRNQFAAEAIPQPRTRTKPPAADSLPQNPPQNFDLHSLGDTETIVRLVTGLKRIEIPDEFNYIKILHEIAARDRSEYGELALAALANTYQARRQYSAAARMWQQSIEQYGDAQEASKQQQLDEIVGNWGRFELGGVQPAGKLASLKFRFRNGKQVAFEAHRIRIPELIKETKAYLRSALVTEDLDERKLAIESIGHRLVTDNEQQYLGEQVAQWELQLEPEPDHFDKQITVETPLKQAGAYLLTARMADGNVSKIIVWISDTAIVKKSMRNKAYYFVADAVTGQPVPGANVELFGYRRELDDERPDHRFETIEFTGLADENGQYTHPIDEDLEFYTWVVSATTPDGRHAYLGFNRLWRAPEHANDFQAVRVFTITDRPVYRPAQTVKYKLWARCSHYDESDTPQFAHKTFQIELYDPHGDKVLTRTATADAYGGIEGEYQLPDDAALGEYELRITNHGGGTFRVEEYKKPEFDVRVETPTTLVPLGGKITAKISASYYFGQPVTQGHVKYTVLRTKHQQQWFPAGSWDWLYGNGYWWFGEEHAWYPGWKDWGCRRPAPRTRLAPSFERDIESELVQQNEVPIGSDGSVTLEFDTAPAQELYPGEDHQYQIIAEVVDPSRRMVVGDTSVIAARKPLSALVWLTRGFYEAGDTIEARFAAHTVDGKPVAGTGKVSLLAVSYSPEQQPIETLVRQWDVSTGNDGLGRLQIKASNQGQYCLRFELTDSAGQKAAGGHLFTVAGQGFSGAPFRFNPLELIPDRRDYKPGESVKLQINANRRGATVLLFVRPVDGVYAPPQVIRLSGKSTVVEVAITPEDMPNFFIEALLVADGKVHTDACEIHVPPASKMLGVEIVGSALAFKPKQKAKLKLKLTDAKGEPFVGSTVLSVYDKALEYLARHSAVPKIQEFFWSWNRSHIPATQCDLDRLFSNLKLPNHPQMKSLYVQETDRPRLKRLRRESGRSETEEAPNQQQRGADRELVREKNDQRSRLASLWSAGTRTNFADTAFWKGAITTGIDGMAEVEFELPENLTTWKVRAWSLGPGTKVGQGEAEIVTRKDLIVRLQAPRFFVEKDEVVLSANVHNYLPTSEHVDVALELEGPTIKPLGELVKQVEVPAGGQARVDWRVRVVQEGTAVVRVKAVAEAESDGMQLSFPVYVHGMLKTQSYSGSIRPDELSGKFTYRVPAERRTDNSRLVVTYRPTLVGTLVDALPYLLEHPHTGTEQTLNRFLSAVITQKTLIDTGFDLKSIRAKRAKQDAKEVASDLPMPNSPTKPSDQTAVFNPQQLDTIVQAGLRRLGRTQRPDGGWGWFGGSGEQSHPHTTALVVHGLQTAQANKVAVNPQLVADGIEWLSRYQTEQCRLLQNHGHEEPHTRPQADDLDALVYMVLVDAGRPDDSMCELLYRDRARLSAYAQSLYGLALLKHPHEDKLSAILESLAQQVVQDDENQTAWLNLPRDNWWLWNESEYETLAYYLKLLASTQPDSELTSRLATYLVNNRKHASYWNSTRDTALVIEALAKYLKNSSETKPDLTVEVWLDGKKQKEVKINAENLFTFDHKFVLTGAAIETGEHTLELRKTGTGPLYFSGYLTYFAQEDLISPAGLEVKVERKFYRLKPVRRELQKPTGPGQVAEQPSLKYEREELADLATLASGELVEVELEIDSKNDYEYLLFEDHLAAGFELLDLRNGYLDHPLHPYREIHDHRVMYFIRDLPRGKHSLTYRLRAELPGLFGALPACVEAVYAPELRGNSTAIRLGIQDPPKKDEPK